MANIKIRLVEPTPHGRIYYYRDPEIEAHLLYICSNIKIKRAFSISIFAEVLISIDSNRRLYGVEIFHAYKFWKLDDSVKIPEVSTPADILFPDAQAGGINIEDPQNKVEIRSDPKRNVILVLFGEIREDSSYVALSEQCFAVVNEDNLVGFIIKLADAPLKVYDTHHGKPLTNKS